MYETELRSIDLQVLQSVLYNAEKQIPKIQLTIEFDTEDQYKNFVNKFAPQAKEDQEVMVCSESDSQDDGDNISGPLASEQYRSEDTNRCTYVEELGRIEMSIILKQHYKERIREIGRRRQVEILIVPQKLKYFGYSDNDIEEASLEVHEIKTNICVNTVDKHGKQVFESESCRRRLSEHGINMGKVAEKYYYWWDSSLYPDEKTIDAVIEQIFATHKHHFFQLLPKYESKKRRCNPKYIQALIETKAHLFETYLAKQINDQGTKQVIAQLNNNRTQIVVHLKVSEQSIMIDSKINQFYNNLIHFFIKFKTDTTTIPHLQQIQTYLGDKSILWYIHKDLLVISYDKISIINSNQSILNSTSATETRQQQFLQLMGPIFNINPNCSIEQLKQQDLIDETWNQQDPFNKRINKQYVRLDGIYVITPRTLLPVNFVKIIKQYILKPCLHPRPKQSEQPDYDESINMNNTTRFGDTTEQVRTEIDQSMIRRDDGLNESVLTIGPILTELKEGAKLREYEFMLEDEQGSDKYDDDIAYPKKIQCKVSDRLKKILQAVTGRDYKAYPVRVPSRLTTKLDASSQIITLFVRQTFKDGTPVFNDIKVYGSLLSQSNKQLSNNGWLINVCKKDVRESEYRYEVDMGKFEIVKYVKFIE